jgi:hypothetical protein
MRAVLDVNVLVSAVITSRGSPGKILELWKREHFELVISPPILEELARVIHHPGIQKRYNLPEERVDRFLSLISNASIIVEPHRELSVAEDDPSDNRYLECAAEGDANYIVSGDKHLLKLKEFEGIVILPPAGFLTLLKLEGQGRR